MISMEHKYLANQQQDYDIWNEKRDASVQIKLLPPKPLLILIIDFKKTVVSVTAGPF